MDIASLILSIVSILFSIAGIVINIFCWKCTYRELKLIKELKRRKDKSFSKSDFVCERDLISGLLEENPDVKNPYDFYSENEKESMRAALFNLQQSQYKK